MAAAQTVLAARGVGKTFGALRAVSEVDFEVAEGEVFGIAGPNGAGKTTLFNLISGIPFSTDSGTITFYGQRIERLSPHRIFRAGLARTFQKESVFDALSVRQNVRVAAAFGRAGSRGERTGQVNAVLARVGLDDVAEAQAATLPLYAKKRLMLAAALVTQPKLLMLDEPGAGLNAVELDEFMKLVLELNKEGLTLIVIEHVLPLLFGVSHRIMIMDSGREIAEGPPEAIARNDAVIEAYLGQRGKEAFRALAG
jgi:branched-chain amino acid transport system ATP-binding protein